MAVSASMYTWNGGSASSSDWSDAGNWENQLSPYGDLSAQLILDGTARTTNTLDQNLGANSLTLASTAGSFAVSGPGTLTLGSGGMTNNSGSAQVFNAPLVLSAAQTWTNNGGALTIGGSIDNGGFDLKMAGPATISGAITGAGGLTSQGGILRLTGNNSYSGGSTFNSIVYLGNGGTTGSITGDAAVNAALLFYRSDAVTYSGVLSGTGQVDMAGTGTLTLTGATNSSTLSLETSAGTTNIGTSMKFEYAAVGSTLNVNGAGQTLTLDSGSVGATVFANSILNVSNGAALVTPSLLLEDGSALNVSGGGTVTTASLGASGNASVTLDNGTLAQTQTGSNSLGFTLNSGGGTVDVSAGQTVAFSGAVGGAGSLTKTGSGVLDLNGTNNYTGNTDVEAGSLVVSQPLQNDDSSHVFIAQDPGGAASNGAEFTAAGLQGASYAGIGSTEIGGDGLSADLLFGTSPQSATTSVTMQWNPGANGDILNLDGMEISGGAPNETDLYVLQMSYVPGELSLLDQDALTLNYFDGSAWVNAIDGNIGANVGSHFFGGWTDDAAHDALGAWGIDTTNDVVWAVLDYDSRFSSFAGQSGGATPEPGTFLLVGAGAAAVFLFRRLRGNA